jgi:hypothetical protein
MDTAEARLPEDRRLVPSSDSSVTDRSDSTDGLDSERYVVRLARATALVLLSIGVHLWIDGRRPTPQPPSSAGDIFLTPSSARVSGVLPSAPLPAPRNGHPGAAAVAEVADVDGPRAVPTAGRMDGAEVSGPPLDAGRRGSAAADSARPPGEGVLRTSWLPDLARTDHAAVPAARRLTVWTRIGDALQPVAVPELGPAQVQRATAGPELARSTAAVSMPAAARVAPPQPPDEEASILQVLRRYERAVARKDPLGAKAVWPSLDDRALARAFNDLQSHSLALQDCGVTVDSVEARATCQGVAIYLPKVGRRKPISASHEWTFNLAKQGGGWHIESAAIQ